METYHGHVRTPADAIILFEACRIGLLPRVQRRLSEKERQSIKSGSVFVWDEREAGMRRWTDGKSWSASRVSGSFLTYREMEGKRGGNSMSTPLFSGNAPKSTRSAEDSNDDGPDGYRYKPDGLMKQSFSITTSSGQHLHLISYYSRTSTAAQNLMQPTSDPQLRHIRPEKGMYPESTVHDHNSIPAVTRGPMAGSGYATSSPPSSGHVSYPYGRPTAQPPYPGFVPAPSSWAPPSPLHTPPHYPHYYGGANAHHYAPYGAAAPQPTSYPAPTYPGHAAPAPPSTTSLPRPQIHPSYPPLPLQHSQSYGSAPGPGPAPIPGQHDPAPMQQRTPTGSISMESKLAEPRHDSVHPRPFEHARKSMTPPGSGVLKSGTTIPSISTLISGAQAAAEERRAGSLSPGTKQPRPLQDIPLHKLGFNPGSDVRALRDLDKATFRI